MAVTPEAWFAALPVVTKTYFLLVVGTTLLTTFGLLNPALLFLDFGKIWENFHFWRLATCFFYFGRFSLPFLFQVFILTRYFGLLEGGYFFGNRGTAEFVFLILFGAVPMWAVAHYWPLYFLGPSLVMMVLYVWSRRDPFTVVTFWGFAFKAWTFPFVLLVFGALLGGNPMEDILGILVGHLYYFVMDVAPRVYGKTLMHCPDALYRLFEVGDVHARNQPWRAGAGHRLN